MKNEIAKLMTLVKEKRPLVHQITNNVTVNDCANITLCAGGSPVMSDSPGDVEEMVNLASALVLNIGTLTDSIVEAMIIAGKTANKLGKPVILDPVGAGATKYRTNTVWKLLEEVKISIIKGNAGEIGALAGVGGKVRGVDSDGIEGDPVEACVALSKRTGAVVVMTGAVDIITDGTKKVAVNNGHEMMSTVSGTGCMTAAVIGCYVSCTDDLILGSAAALAVFNIAGNKAAKRSKGPGSFIMNLKDELSNITENEVIPLANIRLL